MEKGLTAKELMKIGLRGYKEFTPVNWHGKIIQVKHFISLEEEFELVKQILKCCYDKDRNIMLPQLLDLSIRTNIISCYSNVELPDGIEDKHKVLYNSTLYDTVVENVNKSQLDTVIKLVYTFLNGGFTDVD